MSQSEYVLTKTKFISGLICEKRLYLDKYKNSLASPLSASELAIIEESNKIGELARDKYSGGVLIKDLDPNNALLATDQALNCSESNAIFEPAFVFNDVYIRADILLRHNDDSFDLIEVKSSGKVKKIHRYDLAIQYYVIKNNGIQINKIYLMYVNTQYIYDGQNLDLDKFFIAEDLTGKIKKGRYEIAKKINKFKKVLRKDTPPGTLPGKQCKKPFMCQYLNYCFKGLENPVTELPRVSDYMLDNLVKIGITEISEIPKDFIGLTEIQKRVRDAVISNKPFFDSKIKDEIANIKFPVHFLDFEAFNPALPKYSNTTPYQMIPFQWSDHVLYEDGTSIHHEFLHNNNTPPERNFIESLLSVLEIEGKILVFSSFEATRIKELAKTFQDLSPQITPVLDRIIDLQKLIRNYCYYPEFHGSYSLKKVLPTLIPDLSYNDLEIANGAIAANAYNKLINTSISRKEKDIIYNQLLEYCKLDTYAMMQMYKYFLNLV